ncbi:hypothetical protein, partial [Escherichia coli]|uniref:hypothetical protein n=1 Tax=Escherichia coli TaxID=562 RepID=UPI00191AFC05
QKHGLPFNTVQNTRFQSMEDVHLWMIEQHLGRRSVSDFQRGVLALRNRPRLLAGLALPFWLLCAIAGSLLVFLWGFSTHYAAWANRNLLLLSPLAVLLLPGAIALLRRRAPGRMFRVVLWLLAVQAVAALVLHWLSLQAQYNVQWIVLL